MMIDPSWDYFIGASFLKFMGNDIIWPKFVTLWTNIPNFSCKLHFICIVLLDNRFIGVFIFETFLTQKKHSENLICVSIGRKHHFQRKLNNWISTKIRIYGHLLPNKLKKTFRKFYSLRPKFIVTFSYDTSFK